MNMRPLLYIFFIAFTLTSAPAHALLPPLWEGTTEIKAIFEDPQFGKLLGSGEVLEEIQKMESGWKIVTNKNEMNVTVEYLPAEHPGPAHFSLHFAHPSPKNLHMP